MFMKVASGEYGYFNGGKSMLIPFNAIVSIELSASTILDYPHRVQWREPGGGGDVVKVGIASEQAIQSLFLQTGLVGAVHYPADDGATFDGNVVKANVLLSNGKHAAIIERHGRQTYALVDGGFDNDYRLIDDVGLTGRENIAARSDKRSKAEAEEARDARVQLRLKRMKKHKADKAAADDAAIALERLGGKVDKQRAAGPKTAGASAW